MTKRRIVDEDVLGSDALLLEVGLKDVVRRPRIDVVRSKKGELLDLQFFQEVVRRRDRLLVRRSACVEDILGRLFALILNRVEQQAVELFDHRKHRFPAHGRPVAEDNVNFVHGQEFTRLFRKERPVRSRIDDDGFKLTPQNTASGILLLDEHFHGVFQRRFRDCHRP